MSLGLVLLIVGLLVVFGSFVFAAVNMARMVTGRGNASLSGGFTRHIGAIIGMATGGLVAIIGIVILIVQHLE